jgi:hypothetical protein
MKKFPLGKKLSSVSGLSRNPYANIGDEEGSSSVTTQLAISFSLPVPLPTQLLDLIASLAVKRNEGSGNPYRYFASRDEADWDDGAKPVEANAVLQPRATGALSKKDFSDKARRIFLQYTPKLEGIRLRPHYIEFIQRNSVRSAGERYQILERLKRYDLSSMRIDGHFNREADISVRKLAEIENLD